MSRKAKKDLSIDDDHIRHSAAGMIAAFPGRAASECAGIVEKMHRHDDRVGVAVWERILAAVLKATPSAKPAPDETSRAQPPAQA